MNTVYRTLLQRVPLYLRHVILKRISRLFIWTRIPDWKLFIYKYSPDDEHFCSLFPFGKWIRKVNEIKSVSIPNLHQTRCTRSLLCNSRFRHVNRVRRTSQMMFTGRSVGRKQRWAEPPSREPHCCLSSGKCPSGVSLNFNGSQEENSPGEGAHGTQHTVRHSRRMTTTKSRLDGHTELPPCLPLWIPDRWMKP